MAVYDFCNIIISSFAFFIIKQFFTVTLRGTNLTVAVAMEAHKLNIT